MSQLVSWCFKPSQPQKFYIRAEGVSWCFEPRQPQKDYIRAEGDFHKEIYS